MAVGIATHSDSDDPASQCINILDHNHQHKQPDSSNQLKNPQDQLDNTHALDPGLCPWAHGPKIGSSAGNDMGTVVRDSQRSPSLIGGALECGGVMAYSG